MLNLTALLRYSGVDGSGGSEFFRFSMMKFLKTFRMQANHACLAIIWYFFSFRTLTTQSFISSIASLIWLSSPWTRWKPTNHVHWRLKWWWLHHCIRGATTLGLLWRPLSPLFPLPRPWFLPLPRTPTCGYSASNTFSKIKILSLGLIA